MAGDKGRRPRDDDDEDLNEDERPRRRRPTGDNDGGVSTVIPYKNGPALISYYIGIFGLFFCFTIGILSGIPAVVLGIMGLKKVREQPEAHGTVHAWVGIILGALQILTSCCGISGFIFNGMSGPKRF